MNYAIIFGMEISGVVHAGPKAGTTLDKHFSELPDAYTLEDAIKHCDKYKDLFTGTIKIFSRQWHDGKSPVLAENQEWVKTKNKKGGLLYTKNMHTITF